MKALLLLSAVAVASAAAPLNAQVKTAPPDSGCTKDSDGRTECWKIAGARGDSARGRFFFKMDSAMAKRGALGLELRTTGTKRDTLGVFVEAVTPKGPAEAAGIIEGDRIASINGVDLRTSAGDTDDDYTNGLAAHRLGREVQKLAPGAKVNLRVYSGGRFRDLQVTAGKASDLIRLRRVSFPTPGSDGMMGFDGPGRMMMFGPDAQMMRLEPFMRERLEPLLKERLEPLMKERIEPMLRERMRDLPTRIQIRTPLRIKTLTPMRARRTYRV